MNKRIAVFTATRAEYGLLYWLMKDILESPDLDLNILVSGTHLSPEFGMTINEIENDGFEVNEKIEILLSSDSPVGVAKSIGLGVLGFADALFRLKPDVLVLLGDRYEALAVAQTAMILRIPIVHLHGGEITEGAYDDAIRHAITKLSYIHCVSTDEHKKRVIQLGEEPGRVHNVGAIGLDHLHRTKLLSLAKLSGNLKFSLKESSYFIVTYHPVTLSDESPENSFKSLLTALNQFEDYKIILTYPNADDGGRKIIPFLEEYAAENPDRVLAIPSLGQLRYLSALKYAAAVIGNSSSGIIEAPSFHIPTIDIGIRQKGRVAANSVIHSDSDVDSIVNAIKNALDPSYLKAKGKIVNPYGQGRTCGKVIQLLTEMDSSVLKSFYDLKEIDYDACDC